MRLSGRSKRSRADALPLVTRIGSKPAFDKCRAMPSAMTSSSSTIRTFAILSANHEVVLREDREEHGEDTEALRLQAERARMLVEESREMLLVLDAENRVIAASRRAREGLEGVAEAVLRRASCSRGRPARAAARPVPRRRPGRAPSTWSPPGELAAYEELRAGFGGRLARAPHAARPILALLETAALPGEDPAALADQARGESELIRELIDDILFLSELETGRAVVALGETARCRSSARCCRNSERPPREPASRSSRGATRRRRCLCGRACCAS